MSDKIFPIESRLNFLFLLTIFSVLFVGGCTVEAAKSDGRKTIEKSFPDSKNSITVQPESPADTVRVFYKNLRERRFREALFLTNLRPAIEGLTDAELKDLQVDFSNLAKQIPADIEINGEIISGGDATVTAKLPDNETDKVELQQIKLRRDERNNVWVILTLDQAAEDVVKREGKNYFFNLRIETHQAEAKKMLNRIAKAEMVFAMENSGLYAEMPVLIEKKLLPDDAQTSESTGYNYAISLSADRKKYLAAAEPAIYGKTGKLSFEFQVENNHSLPLKSRDAKVLPSKN